MLPLPTVAANWKPFMLESPHIAIGNARPPWRISFSAVSIQNGSELVLSTRWTKATPHADSRQHLVMPIRTKVCVNSPIRLMCTRWTQRLRSALFSPGTWAIACTEESSTQCNVTLMYLLSRIGIQTSLSNGNRRRTRWLSFPHIYPMCRVQLTKQRESGCILPGQLCAALTSKDLEMADTCVMDSSRKACLVSTVSQRLNRIGQQVTPLRVATSLFKCRMMNIFQWFSRAKRFPSDFAHSRSDTISILRRNLSASTCTPLERTRANGRKSNYFGSTPRFTPVSEVRP
mmetsp:Transcript_17602/g.50386  ORF Transcript_17602/g.50386 Transcript_17602/m.50386 type:complete len:288 (+) Transcript_17602:313-1176(+)